MGFNLTETGMFLRTPLEGHLGMMDFDGGTFDRSKPLTREHLQSVLRRVSGTDVTLDEVHLASSFTDRAMQVTTYRNGRVLLAGDAAHIHSPLGGQGLNLGIGDAMNLGWKLAATLHGTAPEGLLDTYTTERHPIGAAILDWSRAQVATMDPGPNAPRPAPADPRPDAHHRRHHARLSPHLRPVPPLRPGRRSPAGRQQRPGLLLRGRHPAR
ncbi:hypothetical protein GCM10020001_087480 [Nonomuraea salmonea]